MYTKINSCVVCRQCARLCTGFYHIYVDCHGLGKDKTPPPGGFFELSQTVLFLILAAPGAV